MTTEKSYLCGKYGTSHKR